jgi:hypothetical protein
LYLVVLTQVSIGGIAYDAFASRNSV